jgi:hypothetical protein
MDRDMHDSQEGREPMHTLLHLLHGYRRVHIVFVDSVPCRLKEPERSAERYGTIFLHVGLRKLWYLCVFHVWFHMFSSKKAVAQGMAALFSLDSLTSSGAWE